MSKRKFNQHKVADVSWDEVAGLDDAKAALREAVEAPIKHAALYKSYGKRPSKGALLYGPPGCGKTLLGKAAAHALKQIHATLPKPKKPEAKVIVKDPNRIDLIFQMPSYAQLFGLSPLTPNEEEPAEDESGFFYVKAPEILDCWLGGSEKIIRELFADARAYGKKVGCPAVIFIDEAEAILSHRSSGIAARVAVPSFLAEMDGFDEGGPFILLATNRPDDLDPAIVRAGRIDRKIRISRPDRAQAERVFAVHLGYRRSDVGAAEAAEALYAADRVLYQLTRQSGATLNVTLGDLMSGASIAMIVDRACESAIERDAAAGLVEGTGLRQGDFVRAIDSVEAEERARGHVDDLIAIVEALGEPVAAARKVARGGATAEVELGKASREKGGLAN